MSDHKDDKTGREYSVDEILAEYGTGRYGKRKVVDFPGQQEPTPAPPPAPKKDKPLPPVDEIVPEKRGRGVAARLSTLRRRVDHYADHMYDQAEPDEETRRAEQYIPGVDREEPAPEQPRPRRMRPPLRRPPDTPAATLAEDYRRGLKGRGRRLGVALFLSLIAGALSFELPVFQLLPPQWDLFQLRCWVLSGLLLAVGALCWEIPAQGLRKLAALRPGAETIALFAWLFSLADGLTAGRLEARQGTLPCAAVTALGLTFHLWGYHCRRKGLRLSAKAASQAHDPYVVTLDENKWSGRPAYTKWSGSPAGFGSQLQMEDGGDGVYRFAAPLLLLAGLLCAVMASVGQGAPGRFPWAASAIFTAAAPWSALLACGLPFHKLAVRLNKVGAALAGWVGAARCGQGGIIMTDGDLFPPGAVKVAQVKVFGGVATEKVVAYTATLLRVLNCGLTRPFRDLVRTQGAFYREASGVRPMEGGMSGIIRNQEVLVGTAAFMHLMQVAMPQGLNVKNALFCALDGELAGMFLLNYAMSGEVNPALSALMRADVSPILATRDFNLIPAMLEQKFKLPVDKLEFPPVERRLELSREDQEHDQTPVALLCREGLSAYSDAVVGGRRLRSATRLALLLAVVSAVAGVALTFYLTAVGAYTSLTPPIFLIFMALWLVPQLLISNWVDQY